MRSRRLRPTSCRLAGALGRLQVGGGVRYTGKSFADDGNTGVNTSVALFGALVAYDFVKLDPRIKGVRAQVNATNVFTITRPASRVIATAGSRHR